MIDVTPTQFDGKGYERMMGRWSQALGEVFLDWLSLPPNLRWIDVGCGNGAFTELLVRRCQPTEVQGIDPSEGQLAFARDRSVTQSVTFRQGDAQALPFEDNRFDAAVMALAINLIPDPAKAVAEMARVVRPEGSVATYMWDINGGGFTMEPIRKALGEMGVATPFFGAEFTEQDRMRELWETEGLDAVVVRRIETRLTFTDFDDFWSSNTGSSGTVAKAVDSLSESKGEELRERLREQLPTDAQGMISYTAHANAVKGQVRR
jgi:ubiquinone/menaquinone biosynthesis C-methylase UbiE